MHDLPIAIADGRLALTEAFICCIPFLRHSKASQHRLFVPDNSVDLLEMGSLRLENDYVSYRALSLPWKVWRAPGTDKVFAPMQQYRVYGGCHDDITSIDWADDSFWLVVASRDLTVRYYSSVTCADPLTTLQICKLATPTNQCTKAVDFCDLL